MALVFWDSGALPQAATQNIPRQNDELNILKI